MAAAGIGNMISDLAGLGLADQVSIIIIIVVYRGKRCVLNWRGGGERPVPPTLIKKIGVKTTNMTLYF